MKRLSMTTLGCLLLILGTGCGDSTGRDGTDEHTGHGHAGHDHAGHAHAAPAQESEPVERCTAHDAPVEWCFLCDPSLRDEGRLWCAGHGRYEDRCWICQPQLRDPDRAYCEDHGLYEDECHLCDPALHATSAAAPTGGLYCLEHDLAESECGICHPELAAGLQPGGEVLVRLPSPRSAELAGVVHGTARNAHAAGKVGGYVEIDYDRNHFARITPRTGGVIEEVFVDVGDAVQPGQALVRLSSAQLAAAKRDFLDARLDLDLKTGELERARQLREQGIGSERQLQTASAARERAAARADAAEQGLINLGLSAEAVATVAGSGDTSSQLVVRAPFAGEIVQRKAVLGESVSAAAHLLSVADLSRMRLELSLPQSALPGLRTGLPVTATFDALPGREIRGSVVWIEPSLDARTRLVRVRAEADNPDRSLMAGLYGRAEVELSDLSAALTLPRESVRDLDREPFVLVRREADLYALRRVELGPRQGEAVAILAGLLPDEPVVVGGGFSVFSELLKSRFGAGCAEE